MWSKKLIAGWRVRRVSLPTPLPDHCSRWAVYRPLSVCCSKKDNLSQPGLVSPGEKSALKVFQECQTLPAARSRTGCHRKTNIILIEIYLYIIKQRDDSTLPRCCDRGVVGKIGMPTGEKYRVFAPHNDQKMKLFYCITYYFYGTYESTYPCDRKIKVFPIDRPLAYMLQSPLLK